jgi:hypothetical protein
MIKNPEWFDVAVTTNMFGDIITDLGAMLQGGMGIAASGNIHPGKTSMFEPIHGSAPKHAGKNVACPLGAVGAVGMMLDFLGEGWAISCGAGPFPRRTPGAGSRPPTWATWWCSGSNAHDVQSGGRRLLGPLPRVDGLELEGHQELAVLAVVGHILGLQGIGADLVAQVRVQLHHLLRPPLIGDKTPLPAIREPGGVALERLI